MVRRRTTVKREIEVKANTEIGWEEVMEMFIDHLKVKGLADAMLYHCQAVPYCGYKQYFCLHQSLVYSLLSAAMPESSQQLRC